MARRRGVFFRRIATVLSRGGRWLMLGTVVALLTVGVPQMAQSMSSSSSEPLLVQALTLEQQFARWRSHYHNGEFPEALAVLQPLVENGDLGATSQALAYNYLSLTQQKLQQWSAARTASDRALQLLGTPGESESSQRTLAAILNTRGQLQFALGDMETAYESWREATRVYESLGDMEGVTGGKLNQVQALQAMGFARRACDTVLGLVDSPVQRCEALEEADIAQLSVRHGNPAVQVRVLQGLGNGLRAIGQFDRARTILEHSLQLAQVMEDREAIARISLDLGNTEASIARRAQELNVQADLDAAVERAVRAYNRADLLAASPGLKLRSQLNQLVFADAFFADDLENPIAELIPTISGLLDALPPSRTTVGARVKLACLPLNCEELSDREPNWSAGLSYAEVETLLDIARTEAETLGDARSQAYVLEALAQLYRWQDETGDRAQQVTLAAIERAETADASELLYRLYWKMGHFLASPIRDSIDEADAIALNYYERALSVLQELQFDLNALDPDFRFSFRDRVEPVYREYAELLLRPDEVSQESLQKATEVIQALQIAEINDFFGVACLETEYVDLTEITPDTALIYALIFPNRLETIANFGNTEFQRYRVDENINFALKILNLQLQQRGEWQDLSQQMYQKVISPIEADLEVAGISQLVFVLDGQLRSLPMAALYDGEQFLIEKYAIAVAPSLQLLEPRRLEAPEIQILAAGRQNFNSIQVTESRLNTSFDFSNLSYIDDELQGIKAVTETRQLFEERFTVENLQKGLQTLEYPLLHIATHGRFSNFAEDTFIVADRLLRLTELAQVLQVDDPSGRNDLDLLVLSACQTARESERAVLGMAGIAIRAGVRSIIGSFWNVNDLSTSRLMQSFYDALSDGEDFNKAEALRQAQISLIRGDAGETFQDPYYWAPFVLVGNWL